jgi:signal transduction histidine kinase
VTALRRARPLSAGVEVVLASAVGVASFALVSMVLVANSSDVLAAVLAVIGALAVVAILRYRGVAFAVPAAVAVLLSYDWYFVPPTHPHKFPDATNLWYLLAYIAAGVVIGELTGRVGRRADTSESARSELAEEQAALRRVATLVARGERPDAVFAVVAEEAGIMLDVDGARVVRFIGEDEILQLEGWSAKGHERLPVGPLKLENTSLATEVMRTGRAVRIDDYASVNRIVPWLIKELGIRSGVAAPIFVHGRLWGAMLAWSLEPRLLPANADRRLVAFTELVGMAISNALSREELALLAREQEALRRVATLVASGVSPQQLFRTVCEEVGLLLDVDGTYMGRYESDKTSIGVGSWSRIGGDLPIGTRARLDGRSVTARVFRTGRPARMDDHDQASGEVAAITQRLGIRSAVGAPIVVDGRPWGAMIASSNADDPLPGETESRIAAFTELVATAISNSEARVEVGRLAGEQAALRRVATLVARGSPAMEVFAEVAREVGELLDAESAWMHRYEHDGNATVVATWGPGGSDLPVGTRFSLEGDSVVALVLRTGRPARIDDYARAVGETGDIARKLGLRSAVGSPIKVGGRLWGAMTAVTARDDPLPASAASHIDEFTELVATAIANAEARTEVGRLADEQAALRRVATLVARGSSPAQVFAKVAEEVGRLMGVDSAWMQCYEPDGNSTVVAMWGQLADAFPVGTHLDLEGENVAAIVRDTGQPARIDDYSHVMSPMGIHARGSGVRSAVGSPIVVNGEVWGSMTAVTMREEPLPPTAESRIGEFTELVATSVSNVQARAELAASRARIVAATDEERRRVVRDLHDGAQQRLVHTVVTLKLARRALDDDARAAPALVTEALTHAEDATAELRELAHGILPSVLTRGGLRAGVVALASRMPVPVDIGISAERFPSAVEATAYFIVAEALTNVAKHARARHVQVAARVTDGALRVQVRDDGVGGARADGSGLVGLADRLGVLDGSLRVDSPRDGGTLIAAEIPIGTR